MLLRWKLLGAPTLLRGGFGHPFFPVGVSGSSLSCAGIFRYARVSVMDHRSGLKAFAEPGTGVYLVGRDITGS